MYLGNYEQSIDGVHIIDKTSGTHLKSFYYSYVADGSSIATNWAGGSVEMANNKVFMVFNQASGPNTMTVDYNGATTQLPTGPWSYNWSGIGDTIYIYETILSSYSANKIYGLGTNKKGLFLCSFTFNTWW